MALSWSTAPPVSAAGCSSARTVAAICGVIVSGASGSCARTAAAICGVMTSGARSMRGGS
eukprot:scaffold16685_cov68-Phaeocystis_antarctica.AAC.1